MIQRSRLGRLEDGAWDVCLPWKQSPVFRSADSASLSSLITVPSAVVKKLDRRSRQCLAQHDETSGVAPRANKLASIGDGGTQRGELEWFLARPSYVGDINRITTCVTKKHCAVCWHCISTGGSNCWFT